MHLLQLKANHGVSGTGNSTLNQNRRGSDDESDAPENGGVEADRQAGLIGGSIVYDEDDRLQFVKNSIYAEIYAYHWLLLEKEDMLTSVESSLDEESAATMTSIPQVRMPIRFHLHVCPV